MQQITLKEPEDPHYCTSYREGDWIVWKCPLCDRYERKLNVLTSEMQVTGKNEFKHIGIATGNAQNDVMFGLTKNINQN